MSSEPQSTRLFLVERFVSGLDLGRLEEITRRERIASSEGRRAGLDVRFVGAVAIPEDETCLCFFTGTGAVRGADRPSSPTDARVLDAIVAGPWLSSAGLGLAVGRQTHN
jgi:hypothetical protein